MRISQAAERTGSGRTRRKIRETEILRAAKGWWCEGARVGGALPIEHRQSPMVPRLSAKHGVGAVLRYLAPSCGGLDLPLMGAERCTGALVDSCFASSFCLNPKCAETHLRLPQTGMNARQMLQMLPRYRPPRGLSHVSTVSHPHTLRSRATQSLADFVTRKNKRTVKLEEMQKLVGCECAIHLRSAAVFPELGAEEGFLACE